jgi:hypothetical protein
VHHLRGLRAKRLEPRTPAIPSREPQLRLFFWCAAVVLGLLHVWARRNDVTPDSISYIEIAQATARGGLHHLVNAYWSPLYPFFLSLVFRYFHPAVQWEFTAAHFMNFGFYLASVASFELFLKEIILLRQVTNELPENSSPVSMRTLKIWAYIFFLWSSYFWLSTAWVTPDLCVAVFAYLATALLFRIGRARAGWLVFAGLGALLGASYLAKSAMLPVSLVFLFSAFWLSRIARCSFRATAVRTLLAVGVSGGIALPLMMAISAAKGRPTFGDVGVISYIEFVNRATRSVHWQGGPPGTGTPLHPTRKINSEPAMYEFSSPVQGSYPPWYDPSYWYDGARPHLVLRDQLWALFRGANMYLKVFSKSGALWVVLVAFWVGRRRVFAWGRFASGAWVLILPPVMTLAMYSLVLVEFRYVAPFALILMLWILAKSRIVGGADPRFARRLHLVVVLAPALAVAGATANDLFDIVRNKPYEPWVVAQQIHAMGIPAGTDIGFIGTGLEAYWVHLAGVRIVVEIPEIERPRYVAADSERRQQVLDRFSSAGAKVVLTRSEEVANREDGWQQIPGTHHFIWEQPLLIAAPNKK